MADVGELPATVVTTTLTVPGASKGAVAEICVAEFTVKLVAAVDPKATAVAPVRLVPVMVTKVPPTYDPELGLIEVTAGGVT